MSWPRENGARPNFPSPPLVLWSRPIFTRPVHRKSFSPAETLATTGRIELFLNSKLDDSSHLGFDCFDQIF